MPNWKLLKSITLFTHWLSLCLINGSVTGECISILFDPAGYGFVHQNKMFHLSNRLKMT